MGNTSGVLSECIEELGKSDEVLEEILEPLVREEFISEITSGITSVLSN